MRSKYLILFLFGLLFSMVAHASEDELKKVIAIQQAQMAQMKADFEAYKKAQKSTLDGLQNSVQKLQDTDVALKNGNRSSCYELILNPGYYANSPNLAVINSLPEASTIEGNSQIGPLTKLMCKPGYFLSGLRVWNFEKILDRAYCCSL
jgi:hypothetical protein